MGGPEGASFPARQAELYDPSEDTEKIQDSQLSLSSRDH